VIPQAVARFALVLCKLGSVDGVCAEVENLLIHRASLFATSHGHVVVAEVKQREGVPGEALQAVLEQLNGPLLVAAFEERGAIVEPCQGALAGRLLIIGIEPDHAFHLGAHGVEQAQALDPPFVFRE
jgi:hypothetical protein